MTEQDAIKAAKVLKEFCADKFETNGPCRCQWDGSDKYGQWVCKLVDGLPMSWPVSRGQNYDD